MITIILPIRNEAKYIKQTLEPILYQKDIEQEICIILMFFGIYLIVAAILSLLAKRYLFNVDFGDIGNWNTSNINNMHAMFNNCTNFDQVQGTLYL